MSAEHPFVLEELLPHKHPMILIDRIVNSDEAQFTATVRISEEVPFFEPPRGVPTYVGIEYVAQTVAALIGMRARIAGGEVKLGYLLGTRKLESTTDYFALGAQLNIRVIAEFESKDLAKYAGEISEGGGGVIVKTSVTVYSGATS